MCFANKERLFSRMSRIKSRTQTEICGDCGASDPSWASINRGILLCAECCSIHRSLGRHISQVKSLRQGSWPPSVFSFVQSLNSHGANSVWEHCLMDSVVTKNLKRKPSSKDPLHPTKADFIRAKHVNLTFVLKPNSQQIDDGISGSGGGGGGGGGNSSGSGSGSSGGGGGGGSGISNLLNNSIGGSSNTDAYNNRANNLENELSKQLWASVRSPNLETSLRLLVQGADPNYFYEEKGSMPLHVASKSGQASQIELLIVYGANISAKDTHGNTAIIIAKQNKHFTIAERLIEASYEVTDRLCNFLGYRKPDHSSGQHLTISSPDHHNQLQNQNEISEQLKIARGKLQLIPNKMFEELVMDVYDEVDRREMEAIWATSALNPEIGAVPFLPTNPHLSATRNQGRQKLARFSPNEFSGLVTDVLIDAQRRQNMASIYPLDSPMTLNAVQQLKQQFHRESNMSDDEPLYDAVASDDDYAALTPITQQNLANKGQQLMMTTTSSPRTITKKDNLQTTTAPFIEVENLRKKLLESFSEIDELKSMVQQLSMENSKLKSRIEPDPALDFDVQLRINLPAADSSNIINDTTTTTTIGQHDESIHIDEEEENDEENENEPVSDGRFIKRPVSMFEPREGPYTSKITQIPESRTTTSMYQMAGGINRKDQSLPLSEEVKHRTDVVTRRIQELWTSMQDITIKNAFVPCSERIRVAVAELSAIFPPSITDETIKNAIKQLNQNTGQIQNECTRLQHALISDDTSLSDQCMQDVRSSAYNLAMATKMLVTQFS